MVQATARGLYRSPGTVCGRAAGAADGLYDARRTGVPRRPVAVQPAGPREDPMTGSQRRGLGSGMWTGRPVAVHVRRKYHVQYVPRAMQTLLHGTGPGYQGPGHGPAGERRACEGSVPPPHATLSSAIIVPKLASMRTERPHKSRRIRTVVRYARRPIIFQARNL